MPDSFHDSAYPFAVPGNDAHRDRILPRAAHRARRWPPMTSTQTATAGTANRSAQVRFTANSAAHPVGAPRRHAADHHAPPAIAAQITARASGHCEVMAPACTYQQALIFFRRRRAAESPRALHQPRRRHRRLRQLRGPHRAHRHPDRPGSGLPRRRPHPDIGQRGAVAPAPLGLPRHPWPHPRRHRVRAVERGLLTNAAHHDPAVARNSCGDLESVGAPASLRGPRSGSATPTPTNSTAPAPSPAAYPNTPPRSRSTTAAAPRCWRWISTPNTTAKTPSTPISAAP